MTHLNQQPTYSPVGRTDQATRVRETHDWLPEHAFALAQTQGLQLTTEHVEVLHFLRFFYIENGWPKSTHLISRILDEQYAERGGKQYLYRLFPQGPINQGTRLAGLPTPAYTNDKSFGSSR